MAFACTFEGRACPGEKAHMKDLEVHCHSERHYPERPVSFTLDGATYKVERIDREWLEPGVRHFRICTEGKKFFELCYDEQNDEWSIC